MRILAIDPGSSQSAWLFLQDGRPDKFGIYPNEELVACLRKPADGFATFREGVDFVAIEQIEPRFGLNPGWETLDTARWVGRFEEAAHLTTVVRLKRSEILTHLGVVTRGPNKVSADSGVRSALIDRYGGSGGKAAAIGLKASQGPLYGLKADQWAALSVAVTCADQLAGVA